MGNTAAGQALYVCADKKIDREYPIQKEQITFITGSLFLCGFYSVISDLFVTGKVSSPENISTISIMPNLRA